MASIEKRGTSWCVRYLVHDEFGKIIGQKRVSGFATKSDAMAAAKDLEIKTGAGIDVHGASATCGQIMELWFEARTSVLEKTTLSKYSWEIDKLRDTPIYNAKIKSLKKASLGALVNDLMEKRGICATAARDYALPLRLSLSWAESEGLIPINPLAGASMPRASKREQVILSEEDVQDLITTCQATNPAFLTPLLLALYGGLCREEISGLTWDDVGRSAVTIRRAITLDYMGKEIRKGPKNKGRQRTVTMPAFVMDHIRRLPHTSEYVACSRTGKRYKVHTYSNTMPRLVAAVNRIREAEHRKPMPKASFHDLRHTHAAMLIKLGIQPKVISERLGHASIKITMDTYGYLMPGMQEHVADALDQAWASGQKSGQADLLNLPKAQ